MNIRHLSCFLLALLAAGCAPQHRQSADNQFYVTILPLRSLVQQIVGSDFTIGVLVPAGASPESFEPTPRQMVALNRSQLIFSVGLIDFEQNLLRSLPESERLVDLSRGIPLLEGSCAHNHAHAPGSAKNHSAGHSHGVDPHIWTSPRALKRMAANAYEAIRSAYPDSVRYADNYARLLGRLDSLDTACGEALHRAGVGTIVIYHPALTYYAADYGLEQLAVEHDGKEPSARHLARLIEQARSKKVRRVFYQAQYPASSVAVIAEDIGACCVRIDPLREEVIENIGAITRQLTDGDE